MTVFMSFINALKSQGLAMTPLSSGVLSQGTKPLPSFVLLEVEFEVEAELDALLGGKDGEFPPKVTALGLAEVVVELELLVVVEVFGSLGMGVEEVV